MHPTQVANIDKMTTSLHNSSPASQSQILSIPKLAQQALLTEIYLTPKPGLVDRANTGAHQDMDINTFLASIEAITPFFQHSYQFGQNHHNLSDKPFFAELRLIGQAAEQKMFQATQGINTHKGAIFAFLLLLAAIGRLEKQTKIISVTSITNIVAALCQGLVAQDLHNNKAATAGEKLFNQFQLTGARGEAESGYRIVREKALPCYRQNLSQGHTETKSLLQTLLMLMAYNPDTNIVHRGGLEGLSWVQNQSKLLLQKGGVLTPNGIEELIIFDQVMNSKRLSPGGSADLIAVTWFLAHFPD